MACELRDHGVQHVFGIPGKESVRLGVELERQGIEFHAARHETQAVMMADGYWRASGRVGVALLAQGAGVANAIGGMTCATRARSGVLVISGDLLASDAGSDPRAKALRDLKGIDPEAVSNGINIRFVRPRSAVSLLADLTGALDLAASGCAVYLCVPSDLFSVQVRAGAEPGRSSTVSTLLRYPTPPDPDATAITETAELLAGEPGAKRPVILAGRGAVRAGALPALRLLAEHLGALLATTMGARSAFRGDAFDIGVCGGFSTPVASELLARADAVLAIGASLNPFTTQDRTIFPQETPIVHVDADASSLGKYVDTRLAIHADAQAFADALLAELERHGHPGTGFRTAEVKEAIASFDRRATFTDQSQPGLIDPRTLMAELNDLLPRQRLLVLDAGLHLHYACEFLDVDNPQDFIFPIDSLAVGLGMGAAVGAAVGRPGQTTVLEVGDGGFMMSLGDLDTAVRLELPLVVIVSNDEGWGAEAQHLEFLGLPDGHVRMRTPSLAAVATAMGAEGHTITSASDLQSIAERLAKPPSTPIVLDCRVQPQIQPESFNFDYAGMFAK